MAFLWSLSDSKSPQVSRTLLNTVVDLKNALVWMVSTGPLISNTSNLFTKPLEIVPSAPVIIGTTVNFIFRSFSVLW